MFETKVVLWDLNQHTNVADFNLNSMPGVQGDNMQVVALSADAGLVAVANGNGIGLWDVSNGTWRTNSMRIHSHYIADMAFSAVDRELITADDDGRLIAWNLASHSTLREKDMRVDHGIIRIAINTNTSELAFTTGEHVGVINLVDRSLLEKALEGGDYGNALAYSPDGKMLATGIAAHGVQLWQAADLEPIGEALLAHKGDVQAVAFSPDGKRLASAGEDNQVILWDLAKTPPAPQVLYKHRGRYLMLPSALTDGFWHQEAPTIRLGFMIWMQGD